MWRNSAWTAALTSTVHHHHTVESANMHAQQMTSTHPEAKDKVGDALVRCIEECFACAQACTACADACLSEPSVDELRQCIRLNLDCADLCQAAGHVASRLSGSNQSVLRQALEACAAACKSCGEECERHAERHEHCRICADACRSCEQACRQASSSVH